DWQAALVSITEAVEIRRTLAQANPAAHLPDLAMSLNNLSNRQSGTGDWQAALVSITEAVEIRRTLAQANPAAHLPDLAGSLNNLSNQQSDTGDWQAALGSITEAVDHYRALTRANPAAHLSDLAGSLNNLSGCQSENGDRQAALASITEAVDLFRTLTQDNPAAQLPNLAMSLNNLSNQQSETGDRQAALVSITEAVEIRRTLAQANPAAHLSDLAGSLNNLSNRQSDTGDRQAALVSITEAVEICRTLTQANPAAHLPDLAGSLNNLSNRQSENGDWQAALASITEAVDHYRTLTQANPAVHLPDLAMSLNNLSNQQSEAEVASSAWENAITDLEFSPLAQAELRSHYAAYLAAHVDVSLAVEQLVQAAQACGVGDRSPLSRARQRVRGAATSLGIQDPRLPDWAVGSLPDDVLELLDQWASAIDWPTTEAFLHAHADRLRQPDFRRGLELAAALFPESPVIDELTGFLGQIDAEGLDVILDRGRHYNEVRQTLDAWIATPTWAESKDFLDGHDSILRAPEAQALLAGADAPEARQHLAILQLTGGLSSDQVYEIVTDPDVATEHAFAAVDQADVLLMRRVVTAHPALLTGITGAFFATVSAAANGATDQARQLAQAIAERGTDTQRRAYAIRLRALAGLPAALAGAGELADVIHPDKHS
ncbi:tetratricopeptide repeat protein, partial [Streptomyces sp. SP18BB07]|nr:tetratricopeptide repeat protein [Streptomyces sp. SP18BB07]